MANNGGSIEINLGGNGYISSGLSGSNATQGRIVSEDAGFTRARWHLISYQYDDEGRALRYLEVDPSESLSNFYLSTIDGSSTLVDGRQYTELLSAISTSNRFQFREITNATNYSAL